MFYLREAGNDWDLTGFVLVQCRRKDFALGKIRVIGYNVGEISYSNNFFMRGGIFMITPELLERINTLARKRRTQGLDEEETQEQARLRRIYLDSIKEQVRGMLDSIEFVDAPSPQMMKPEYLHHTNITLGRKLMH